MRKPCSVPGCEKPRYGHGFCNKHWARLYRKGTLSLQRTENGEKLSWIRTIAIVLESDDCLKFPFPVGSHGYGQVIVDGERLLAHQYICMMAHGNPPTTEHQAAHWCGVKLCMNKRHLRWATRSENEADKIIHERTSRGERHGLSKLSRDQILLIRAASGSQRKIAKQFGIVQQTVSDIKTRRRWAWL